MLTITWGTYDALNNIGAYAMELGWDDRAMAIAEIRRPNPEGLVSLTRREIDARIELALAIIQNGEGTHKSAARYVMHELTDELLDQLVPVSI